MKAPPSPLSSRAQPRDLQFACPASNPNESAALPFVIPSAAEGSAVHFSGPPEIPTLVNNLIERILDNPGSPRTFKLGNNIAQHALFEHRIHRRPTSIAQCGHRR